MTSVSADAFMPGDDKRMHRRGEGGGGGGGGGVDSQIKQNMMMCTEWRTKCRVRYIVEL